MWRECPLGNLAAINSGGTPATDRAEFWGGDIPWVTPTDITACKTNYLFDTANRITKIGLHSCSAKFLPAGSILFTSRATVGVSRIAGIPVCTNQGFKSLTPSAGTDGKFLFYQVQRLRGAFERYAAGSTFPEINKKDTARVLIPHPADVRVQQKIATILTSIDTAIEKTEALIEKYQQIKAGLMHDLFTRGVLPNGQLRPPREQAPELYQETEIGWMPKEWNVDIAERVLESIADGPFGSNLKTEHYVVDASVRVVRLQNISSYEYADGDKAYISAKHASFLIRNKVVGGDVLIAGLGDERYPVARACCYPDALPPAVNKADCFRARCNTDIMSNIFFMLFLNSEIAQRQTRRYEQGVTRPRINTGNMKRLLVCVPEMNEQKQFVAKFEAMQTAIHAKQANLEILRQQKLGLMQDLLTGKVPVQVDHVDLEVAA
jgi:type I restriction enzyme S subunit